MTKEVTTKKEIIKSLLLVFLVILLSNFLPINSIAASSIEQQIEEVKQQIQEIKMQNQKQIEELQRKVQELESERATEKEKIEELIAEEKDVWWKKISAGYKKGFFIESSDGNYKLKIKLRGQFQFSVNDTDGKDTATDFRVRRLRLYFVGHAFRPWFLYKIQLRGESGNVQLEDAYFDFAYNTDIVPRIGFYKAPFNREELNSSSALQLVERSIVNDEFTFGHDIGVAIYGVLGNIVTYGGGVFNGNGRAGRSTDSNLLYAGRIQFGCCGKLEYSGGRFPSGGDFKITPNFGGKDIIFVAGAAVAGIPGLDVNTKTPDNDLDERFAELGITKGDVVSIAADFSVKNYIANLEGSYIGRWIDPDEGGGDTAYDQGFRIQGGIFLLPKTVELAARYAYIDFDDASDVVTGDVRDSEWEITPGINYYISHNQRWKIQFSYSFIRNEFTESSDIDENIFRAQLQAYF